MGGLKKDKMDAVITNIFKINLGVKKGERVLVFTDIVREDEGVSKAEKDKREATRQIAKQTAELGKAFASTIYLEFPSVGSHGAEPPPEVWECAFGKNTVAGLREERIFNSILSKKAESAELKLAGSIVGENAEDAVDCVIALSNYSTSHTRFRELLTRFANARYASMPLFEKSMLTGVMRADWNVVKKRTEDLAAKITNSDTVHIKTPNGTCLSFSIMGRTVIADTGILTAPGSFGNLPAGEAFVAPVEGSAEGKMVLEWAPTRKLKSPVILEVAGGRVVKASGEKDLKEYLEKAFASMPLASNIAEFGVGTNDRAEKADNILESEKILGTIHIALGDNSTFGGSVCVPFHQDFVFFNPTVGIEKDGKMEEILRGGKLIL